MTRLHQPMNVTNSTRQTHRDPHTRHLKARTQLARLTVPHDKFAADIHAPALLRMRIVGRNLRRRGAVNVPSCAGDVQLSVEGVAVEERAQVEPVRVRAVCDVLEQTHVHGFREHSGSCDHVERPDVLACKCHFDWNSRDRGVRDWDFQLTRNGQKINKTR